MHNILDETHNDFSYWYSKVKECGLEVPKSIVVPIEDKSMYEHFCMEAPLENYRAINEFVEQEIFPELEAAGMLHMALFVKNARFSNKFHASDCLTDFTRLTSSIMGINYTALCFGAEGLSEVVIRERIMADGKLATIYGGLPLRPEFRVFYDFDKRSIIFTANYWDYDYVYPNLYNETDKLVFQAKKSEIEYNFNKYKSQVETMVSEAMQSVSGLTGKWSIDIMMDEPESVDSSDNKSVNERPSEETIMILSGNTPKKPRFYLIDMALAEMSAYWKSEESREGK